MLSGAAMMSGEQFWDTKITLWAAAFHHRVDNHVMLSTEITYRATYWATYRTTSGTIYRTTYRITNRATYRTVYRAIYQTTYQITHRTVHWSPNRILNTEPYTEPYTELYTEPYTKPYTEQALKSKLWVDHSKLSITGRLALVSNNYKMAAWRVRECRITAGHVIGGALTINGLLNPVTCLK